MRLILSALLIGLAALSVQAAPPAQCEIARAHQSATGPCDFHIQRGGSFTVRMQDGSLIAGAASVSLHIAAPGQGTLGGTSPDDKTTDWGAVQRNTDDPACWFGDSVAICVRGADHPPPPDAFAGRCHMDGCSWVDQSAPHQIAQGSIAVPGRRIKVTQRLAYSQHPGANYPDTPPAGLEWSDPVTVQFFCSPLRPAFATGASWIVLPLPQVFGATESVTRMYLHACHPGTDDDPYTAPAMLGYTAGQPARDKYPDFHALIR
ncbi:MAG: hypothetical protein Q4G22_06675 [Paracoccus sp. (in: a-proteobacteria)]|uniref:hypothetical protein n=1 Tax=Paracoccus sp. TaxID=267 RepID=UPI0026E0340A|nr:hypothetical protein [Paracoccus sp. (in: a-proteobacteria)]MDO5631505.1 hypothetical protein [Paracoccus sp. (in: a-proteobacteria)]